MNTLYILDDPGRDKHFHDYTLKGLRNSGFNPTVVYFTGKIQDSRLRTLGHNAVALGIDRRLYKNFNPIPIIKIVKLIRRTGAGIVHVQRHRALIYAGIACRITGTPLIYTIRQVRLIRNATRRIAFKAITPVLARIISVSQGSKLDFVSRTDFPPEKITVIPNGIDVRPYQLQIDKKEARKRTGLPDTPLIIGMAAGMRKAKDHIGLVRAFNMAKERIGNCIMAFAGDGAMKNAIKKEISKHALDDRILLTGKLTPEEIPLFLKSLDIFVHASFREGMPAAILEAMAAGLPIIATDAEGVPELFDTSDHFGRMVEKGDTGALAEAMVELCNMSGDELKRLGNAAERRLHHGFTSEQMASRIAGVYNEILSDYTNSPTIQT